MWRGVRTLEVFLGIRAVLLNTTEMDVKHIKGLFSFCFLLFKSLFIFLLLPFELKKELNMVLER